MYNAQHLNKAKNRPAIDLDKIEQLKKEAVATVKSQGVELDDEDDIIDYEDEDEDEGDDDMIDEDDLEISTTEEKKTTKESVSKSNNDTTKIQTDTLTNEDDDLFDNTLLDDMNDIEDFTDDSSTDDVVSDYIALFRASDIEDQLQSISDSDALHDWMAPQGRAFQWLVNEDERMINANDPYLVQRYVLAVLFYATNGENWNNEALHWMSLMHECFWNKKVKGRLVGVTECDEDKNVVRIEIPENNLQGSLPLELGLLKSLKVINFESNRLTGKIPTTIGFLTNLTSFSIESNSIKGKIPNKFDDLDLLAELKVNHNDLTGSVPDSVCSLRKKSLYLLWSDCDDHGHPAAITCKCCTECCDGLDMCYSQIPFDDDTHDDDDD